MSEQEVEKVKTIFKHFGADAEFKEHAPVLTSEQAAEVRGGKLEEGVKSMLIKEKGSAPANYAIVNVPANLKVGLSKVARFLSVHDVEIASPAEVLEQTGCELGAVPPLAHKNKLRILVDNRVFNNKYNEFNCGLRTASVRIRSTDLRRIFEQLGFSFGDFAK